MTIAIRDYLKLAQIPETDKSELQARLLEIEADFLALEKEGPTGTGEERVPNPEWWESVRKAQFEYSLAAEAYGAAIGNVRTRASLDDDISYEESLDRFEQGIIT